VALQTEVLPRYVAIFTQPGRLVAAGTEVEAAGRAAEARGDAPWAPPHAAEEPGGGPWVDALLAALEADVARALVASGHFEPTV
jgi:hypothetical protein